MPEAVNWCNFKKINMLNLRGYMLISASVIFFNQLRRQIMKPKSIETIN
jgi:hypothetical protein